MLALTALAMGGVPLLAGLGGLAGVSLALLPGRSLRHLRQRLIGGVLTLVIGMGAVWMVAHHLPANPSLVFEGDRSFPSGSRGFEEFVRRLNADGSQESGFGFEPVEAMRRYADWLGDLFSGDLGFTQYSETVTAGVARTIPISLQLLVYSQVIAVAIAVPGAMLGARRRGDPSDVLVRSTTLFGLSSPVFMIGPVLVFLFAVGELGIFGVDVGIKLFPSGRYTAFGENVGGHFRSMALPTFTLAINSAAVYLVLLRSEISAQLSLEHVELAAAKGVPDRQLVRRHALRPAAPSVVAAVAAHCAVLLGQLLIIERIFLLPGFGDYVLIAIVRNDIPAIVGALFVILCVLVVVNLVAEAAIAGLDPRHGADQLSNSAARSRSSIFRTLFDGFNGRASTTQ